MTVQTPGRRKGPPWWLWLVALALIGGGVWWVKFRPQEAAKGPTWITAPVDRGNISTTVTATGRVQPVRVVEVGAEISGRVIEVTVEADAMVEAGTLLARLDPEPLTAKKEQSEAQLAVVEASLRQAAATLTEMRKAEVRAQQLVRKGLISQEELESAVAARARAVAAQGQAEAQKKQAEAALRQVLTDLAKAEIHAPISGMVLTRVVEPGQSVAASLQTPVLFTIAEDLRRMQLELALDEADVGAVKAGMKATFTVDAFPRQVFDAQVVAVRYAPTVEQNVVTYETVLTVENPDLLLRPGMTATATITASEVKDVLRVPNAALRFAPPREANEPSAGSVLTGMGSRPGGAGRGKRPGGPRVWLLKDGKPTPLPVVAGATDGRFTEVSLKEGDALKEGVLVLTGTEVAK
jgi:HlyD family secretion protein